MPKESRIDITIKATDQTSNVLKDIEGKMGAFANTMKGLGGVVAGVFSVGMIKGWMDASNDAEQASAQLSNALANQGMNVKGLQEQMERLSASMQKVGIFEDDSITRAQALLVSYTKVAGKGLEPLIKATADFAAAKKMDIETAAELVGKTIQGSDALGRYGIKVSDTSIVSLRFAEVLGQLQGKFAGLNEEIGKTATGRMKQLENAWNDATERMGMSFKKLIASISGPLTTLMSIVGDVVTFLVGGVQVVIGGTIKILIGVVQALVWVAEQYHLIEKDSATSKWLEQAQKDLTEFTNEGAKVAGTGITGLFATFTLLDEGIKDTSISVNKLTNDVKKLAVELHPFETKKAKGFVETKPEPIEYTGALQKVDKVEIAFKDIQTTVGDAFNAMWQESDAWAQSFSVALYELGGTIGQTIGGAFASVFGGAKTLLGQFVESFMSAIVSLATQIAAAGLLNALFPGLGLFGGFAFFHQGGQVPKAHNGMFVDAPSSQDVPIIVRGGEYIFTEQQMKSFVQAKKSVNISDGYQFADQQTNQLDKLTRNVNLSDRYSKTEQLIEQLSKPIRQDNDIADVLTDKIVKQFAMSKKESGVDSVLTDKIIKQLATPIKQESGIESILTNKLVKQFTTPTKIPSDADNILTDKVLKQLGTVQKPTIDFGTVLKQFKTPPKKASDIDTAILQFKRLPQPTIDFDTVIKQFKTPAKPVIASKTVISQPEALPRKPSNVETALKQFKAVRKEPTDVGGTLIDSLWKRFIPQPKKGSGIADLSVEKLWKGFLPQTKKSGIENISIEKLLKSLSQPKETKIGENLLIDKLVKPFASSTKKGSGVEGYLLTEKTLKRFAQPLRPLTMPREEPFGAGRKQAQVVTHKDVQKTEKEKKQPIVVNVNVSAIDAHSFSSFLMRKDIQRAVTKSLTDAVRKEKV